MLLYIERRWLIYNLYICEGRGRGEGEQFIEAIKTQRKKKSMVLYCEWPFLLREYINNNKKQKTFKCVILIYLLCLFCHFFYYNILIVSLSRSLIVMTRDDVLLTHGNCMSLFFFFYI